MGDYLKKIHAENFKKARDQAAEDARRAALFTRNSETIIRFTMKPVDGSQFCQNEELLLMTTATDINVVRGYERVGTIEGEGAEIAKRLMSEFGTPTSAMVSVVTVAEMSGVAQARIVCP